MKLLWLYVYIYLHRLVIGTNPDSFLSSLLPNVKRIRIKKKNPTLVVCDKKSWLRNIYSYLAYIQDYCGHMMYACK